ncbi:hypothetical protein BJ912DRAFT_967767 [Pholiota molesta]|nr:hypothetical protein BJ912DRAFT_967767 [Pholiota molesta]
MYANFARLFAIAAVALVGVNAAPAANVENRNATAAVALVGVNAATAANVENLNARAAEVSGHLYVCTDFDFTGDCVNFAFEVYFCYTFDSPFQDSISSFGPDVGFFCTTYVDAGCQGLSYTAVNPGFSTLPPGINDQISSFVCAPQ